MKNEILEMGIITVIEEKGFETAIKEMLEINKTFKPTVEKKHIEEEGNEELGIYVNEIAYATFQLEVISTILSYRKLYEDRKHIKTLCDEIREIADGLEKLI